MFFLNPVNTIRQLRDLQQHVATMALTEAQKREFPKLIQSAIDRLQAERAFIAEHVQRNPPLPGAGHAFPPSKEEEDRVTWPLSKAGGAAATITVSWPDPACPKCAPLTRTIAANTSLAQSGAILRQVMLAEERKNGDPMLELGANHDGDTQARIRDAVQHKFLSSAGCPVVADGQETRSARGAR